jgi:hypothetical protein
LRSAANPTKRSFHSYEDNPSTISPSAVSGSFRFPPFFGGRIEIGTWLIEQHQRLPHGSDNNIESYRHEKQKQLYARILSNQKSRTRRF